MFAEQAIRTRMGGGRDAKLSLSTDQNSKDPSWPEISVHLIASHTKGLAKLCVDQNLCTYLAQQQQLCVETMHVQ